MSAAIADNQPGDTVSVTYYRGDDKRTAKIKLGDRPAKLDTRAPAAVAELRHQP